jgi:hypothetical protein
LAALDVEELFHANVGAKPGLGDDEAVFAHKLQRNLDGTGEAGEVCRYVLLFFFLSLLGLFTA